MKNTRQTQVLRKRKGYFTLGILVFYCQATGRISNYCGTNGTLRVTIKLHDLHLRLKSCWTPIYLNRYKWHQYKMDMFNSENIMFFDWRSTMVRQDQPYISIAFHDFTGMTSPSLSSRTLLWYRYRDRYLPMSCSAVYPYVIV